jgi:pyruvate dehydrogenase E2 component (dihydrolipoamide acetyltransferase)
VAAGASSETRRPPVASSADQRHKNQTAAATALSASPIARRLASEAGIDLSTIKGTGPGGRIVEADVRAAIAEQDEA